MPSSQTTSLRSTTFFAISDYRDTAAAANAAAAFADRYTRGHYPGYQPPRLFVSFDKVREGYFIEPNPVYVPEKNGAWQCLISEENRKTPVLSPSNEQSN